MVTVFVRDFTAAAASAALAVAQWALDVGLGPGEATAPGPRRALSLVGHLDPGTSGPLAGHLT